MQKVFIGFSNYLNILGSDINLKDLRFAYKR